MSQVDWLSHLLQMISIAGVVLKGWAIIECPEGGNHQGAGRRRHRAVDWWISPCAP
jgi:hypothetical protein